MFWLQTLFPFLQNHYRIIRKVMGFGKRPLPFCLDEPAKCQNAKVWYSSSKCESIYPKTKIIRPAGRDAFLPSTVLPSLCFHLEGPCWTMLTTARPCSLTPTLLWRRPCVPLPDLPLTERVCCTLHVQWAEWGWSPYMGRLWVSQLSPSAWVQVDGCFHQEWCGSKPIQAPSESTSPWADQ